MVLQGETLLAGTSFQFSWSNKFRCQALHQRIQLLNQPAYARTPGHQRVVRRGLRPFEAACPSTPPVATALARRQVKITIVGALRRRTRNHFCLTAVGEGRTSLRNPVAATVTLNCRSFQGQSRCRPPRWHPQRRYPQWSHRPPRFASDRSRPAVIFTKMPRARSNRCHRGADF